MIITNQRTDSTVHGNHGPCPRKGVENVNIAPVRDEDRPARVCGRGHEEAVEGEDGVDEDFDVR